jgi:hypothetical protein
MVHLQSKRVLHLSTFLKATLNCAFSFLRTVWLGSQLLKILTSRWNVLFWKQYRLAFCVWRWCLFLVLILCIGEFVWKFLWLFIVMFIDESIHWLGTGGICNCLSRLLGGASAIIFFKWSSSHCCKSYPPKIIPYFIIEWKYA